MLSPYFVVSRDSGHIIRVTRSGSPPPDTDTVFNFRASTQSLHRYQLLQGGGQELISLASVRSGRPRMSGLDQELLLRALDAATNPMLISTRAGRTVWVNKAACVLSGYSRDELLGHTPPYARSDRQDLARDPGIGQALVAGRSWQGEWKARHKDGTHYRMNQVITPILDNDRTITHFITVQHPFTAQHIEHAEMRRLAHHDELTGLPNRKLFRELVHQAILHADRHGKLLALMFIDLDRFKTVNDELGHACGDNLLIAVAERLTRAVRKSDMVARLSGDEFAILIGNLDHASVVDRLAAQLVASIDRPFRIGEHSIATRASVGISFYRHDGQTFGELIDHADKEMYRAKASGGGVAIRSERVSAA